MRNSFLAGWPCLVFAFLDASLARSFGATLVIDGHQTLTSSQAADALTITPGSRFDMPSRRTLTVNGGPIVNDGLLVLHSDSTENPYATLDLQGDVTIDGSGALLLNHVGGIYANVQGTASGVITHSATHTVHGQGSLNVPNFVNHGSIIADVPDRHINLMGAPLAGPSGYRGQWRNTGTIRSEGGFLFVFNMSRFTNEGDFTFRGRDDMFAVNEFVNLAGTADFGGRKQWHRNARISVEGGIVHLTTPNNPLEPGNILPDLLVTGGTLNVATHDLFEDMTLQAGRVSLSSATPASLTIATYTQTGGLLDLANGSLLIQSGDQHAIRASILAGRGSNDEQRWNTGTGITSSIAAQAFATDQVEDLAVGYAPGRGPFSPIPSLDPDSLFIRLTRNADANLDGIVNNNDITILAGHYRPGQTGKHWYQADFNYDGKVDNNDITILAGFYAPNASPLAASPVPPFAPSPVLSSLPLSPIPEPALSLLLLPLAALRPRRRQ